MSSIFEHLDDRLKPVVLYSAEKSKETTDKYIVQLFVNQASTYLEHNPNNPDSSKLRDALRELSKTEVDDKALSKTYDVLYKGEPETYEWFVNALVIMDINDKIRMQPSYYDEYKEDMANLLLSLALDFAYGKNSPKVK